VRGVLREADPGIDECVLARHAGGARALERRGELGAHLAHHVAVGRRVVALGRAAAQVHQHRRHAAPGHERRHRGIVTEAAHVVDDVGARVERGLGDRRLRGVDRDRPGAMAPERLDHGNDAPALLVLRDGLGTRAGRLAAYVQPVGALLEQPQAVRERGLGALRPARERVGGDVQDAHHERALAEHHGGAPERDAVKAALRGQARPLRGSPRTSAADPPRAAGESRPGGPPRTRACRAAWQPRAAPGP